MKKTSETSVISVIGNGRIETEANILEIWIEIYKTKDTLSQSQKEVNQVVSDIIKILKENNINEKDIHTTSIRFEPNYTWENHSKVYTGQKVEQNLICIIDNIKDNIGKAVKILDSITVNSDSITLDLSFGIKEDREMVLKCRELAYQDGLVKAKRYAELAGLKIIKAVKIAENESSSYSRENRRLFFREASASSEFSTQLPIGRIEKSMDLYIDFIAE
ncbi:hypothetical protein R84B8_00968 [Treponema sp. R8-4-B8]